MFRWVYALIFTLFVNFAQAEMLVTVGEQMGDDIYEGLQIGVVQPLAEFDATASFTDIDHGSLITLGVQKGAEVFTSTIAYGFFDINRFMWDDAYSYRCKTQIGYGLGVSVAVFDPIFIEFKLKKFEEYSDEYTYAGIAYMF